jgi:hypothetical protein
MDHAAALLLGAGLAVHALTANPALADGLFVAAIVVGGYHPVKATVQALLQRRITVNAPVLAARHPSVRWQCESTSPGRTNRRVGQRAALPTT